MKRSLVLLRSPTTTATPPRSCSTLEAHPFRGRLFSPHAGLGGAYARHKENYIGSNEVDSRLTAALLGGIDVNFTPRLGIGADMLYSHFGDESTSARFRW